MPFKVGSFPIRRTLDYLNSGILTFKPRVQIMTVNYNDLNDHPSHKGAKDFVFWNLPQIQYKNPGVQIVTFKNLTPTPFVTCYLDDGSNVIFDVDSQTNIRIVERLVNTLGKSKETLKAEELASKKLDNPANFGSKCPRFCMCGETGQLPCPSTIPLPKHWRGKYYHQGHEDEE